MFLLIKDTNTLILSGSRHCTYASLYLYVFCHRFSDAIRFFSSCCVSFVCDLV